MIDKVVYVDYYSIAVNIYLAIYKYIAGGGERDERDSGGRSSLSPS